MSPRAKPYPSDSRQTNDWPPCSLSQEYTHGTLVAEEPATSEFHTHYKPPNTKKKNVKAKKAFKINYQRHKQNKLGETVFKGHRSYDLMLNLQLGVRW